MKIHFCIKDSTLTRKKDDIITSFSKNSVQCVFHCKDRWSDVYKYALFTDSLKKQYIVDLGTGEKVECIIPEEVLKTNNFNVSVFSNDLERHTTTQVNVLVQTSGFNKDTEKLIDDTSSNDLDDQEDFFKISREQYYARHNLFEIEEHPYY